MKNKLTKGFTLIELLVVIAIIGILASVVLASLNSARAKGADARVKSQLANMRAQAEIYYDGTGNEKYKDVCTATAAKGGLANFITDGITCNDSDSSWAASAQLKADNTKYWCADSTGVSAEQGSGHDTGKALCK